MLEHNKNIRQSEKLIKISFPTEEIEILKTQERIITTRVSKEYNKYHEGDIVETSWGKVYKITKVVKIKDIKEHPYYNELTTMQIKLLSKYKKIDVITAHQQKKEIICQKINKKP